MPDQLHGRKPKSILSIDDISKETILHLFDITDRLIASDPKTYNTCLQDHGVAHLFFEPSTRTHYSFEIAEKRLGAIVLNPNINIYIGSYDNEENINRKSNIHRARLSKFKKSKLNGEMIFQDDEQRIYKFNDGKKVYL